MIKYQKNQQGFSAIEALLVLIIIGAIAAVGWYVWHAKQNVDKNLTQASSGKPVVTPTPTFTKPTTDIYAGWKSYTLQYEKLSFKYPSDWQVKDTSADKSDSVVFTASSGLTMDISTGGLGHPSGDAPMTVVKATPISLAGQSVFLDYVAGMPPSQDASLVYQVFVSKSATDPLDTLTSKTPGSNSGPTGNMLIILSYGGANGKTLTELGNSDINFVYASSVIESMTY